MYAYKHTLFSCIKYYKMKQLLSGLVAAICMAQSATACDVCGCTASNQFMGILPAYRYNFAGIQFLSSNFSATSESLYAGRPATLSCENYQTLQVWGRYNLGHNYQVFVFVPYQYNTHSEGGSRIATWSGIGDISAMVSRKLWSRDNCSNSQVWVAGIGIKAPTGQHKGIMETDKLGLPNMQPGSGATDILLSTYYNQKINNWSVTADAGYTFTTSSNDQYKYGNRLNTSLLAARVMTLGKFTLQPLAGGRLEYSLHDYDNYSRKWLNESSGGYMLFAVAGIQAYYKKAGARITYQAPLSQKYSEGNVAANYKFETGIFYLF